MAQLEESLEQQLLAVQQPLHNAVSVRNHPENGSDYSTGGGGGTAPPSSVRESSTTLHAGAALDAIIDGSGFGAFQWKICALVGAVVYMPAGWIMLPVFVNPQLAQQQPDVFTESRLALLGSVFFAGWAVGAPLCSSLADRLGRKTLTLSVLPVAVLVGILPMLPDRLLGWLPAMVLGHPRYYALQLVARCLLGGCIGSLACGFVWMMEWMPSRSRAYVTVAMNCIWAGVAIAIAGLAWFLTTAASDPDTAVTWPGLQLAATLPFVFYGVLIALFAPESARWQLSVGRTDRAEAGLRDHYRLNNRGQELPRDHVWPWLSRARSVPQDDGGSLAPASDGLKQAAPGVPAVATPQELQQLDRHVRSVWTPQLLCHASVLFLCWFTATLTYYGLGFSAGDMAGGLYANSIALSAVDIPGNLLYAMFANRPMFGRRFTQSIFFGLGGLCLLVAPVTKAAFGYTLAPWAAKGLAIAGKLSAAGVFNGVYVYAAEVFPTTVRSTGLGCCNIFARVGGILAPQALQLGPDTMAALFGGLAVASGLATLLLPETLGRVLE